MKRLLVQRKANNGKILKKKMKNTMFATKNYFYEVFRNFDYLLKQVFQESLYNFNLSL